MKRNSIFICVALICLFASFSANAQRPVWVVGHACNSHLALMNAVRDGASGVEIDIHTIFEHADNDWSVNHGSDTEKYLNPTERETQNHIQERTGLRRYVSLKEYLNFEEMDKINILWLDVKTENCGKGLVKYVHEILLERYHSIDKVPFSIIYGFYGRMDFSPNFVDLSSLLWENEGISLAYEGKDYGKKWRSGSFDDIEDYMKKGWNLPIEQHFMTCGFGWGQSVTKNSIEPQCIRQAREKMLKDQYCSRVGFWTCGISYHGLQLVCAKEDYHDSYETECDLILIECDSDFFPLKFPGFDRWALQNFINRFLKEDGDWYRNNNKGHYRLATKDDKFYIKYSDPRHVK